MKIRKKQIVQYGTALVSLAVSLVLSGVSASLGERLDSQKAAQRWQGKDSDVSYAQVSVFFGPEANFTSDSAEAVGESVTAALRQAGMDREKNDPRLWFDAYSIQAGQMTVKGIKRGTASALVTTVGNDFFTMHPMQLLDGVYLNDQDLMQDRVILDETLAWDLFGSAKVSGMEVCINDMRYLVAGVVRTETDSASVEACGDQPRMFISARLYDQWALNGEVPTLPIGCYEIVMPEVVRDYAKNTVSAAIGERDCMRIVQNTGRSSLARRWQNLRHLSRMVVVPDSVAYPYWENAARVYDFEMAVLLGAQILFLVWPVLALLMLFWTCYRWIDRRIAKAKTDRKYKYRTTRDIQV